MVKRITAAVFALLLLSVSILGQIDYNKQIKNAPAVSQGNMNGVRVVDGLKFAQSAAGINAADADLGTAFGEIWIPSTALAGMTATDAQISISKNHTLRLMGRLNIDSVNKGPILLATGAKIICNEADTSPIINVGVGTSPSLIRLAVQDGSVTDGLFVEGCLISAGIQPVTNGVIDASGSANLAKIRDNYIFGFTSGWGIFIQDIQSGALGGTDNLEIQGNNITASNPGSGGCIEITHSSTNAVTLNNISIIDNTCIPGPSLAVGAPIVAQNLTTSTKVEQINILNLNIFALPASQEGVYINGVFQATVKHVFCGSGTSCVYIASNTNNLAISAENIACSGCTNVLQDIANNYTNPNNYVNHYGFNVASSQGFSGNNIFTGVTTISSLGNNIRMVDCVRFSCSASGINAADASFPANTPGEIWLPSSITATDAQISVGAGHVLRVFGTMTINALTTGPILLGTGAGMICMPPSPDNNAMILNLASGTSPSMIRLTAQDGSQTNNFIEGCSLYNNVNPVSNGVIDATGFVNRGWIRGNKIWGYTGGWGIFIQDVQSGALAGTAHLEIQNNTIQASTAGSCIEVTHSATNAVSINHIYIEDTVCNPGASSTSPGIFFQNLAPNASLFGHFAVTNLDVSSNFTAPGVQLAGGQSVMVKNVWCNVGAACVSITNTGNNLGQTFDNIWSFSGNTLIDSLNSVTLATQIISHYDLANGTAAGYYPNVSYLKVNGLQPTSATGTGFGTGPAFAFEAGSTNNAGVINITTGTTPSSSGTVTLNFNTTQSTFGTNHPSCQWSLANNGGAWNGRAVIITGNTISNTTINALWDNNAINLTASVVFNIAYWCTAK